MIALMAQIEVCESEIRVELAIQIIPEVGSGSSRPDDRNLQKDGQLKMKRKQADDEVVVEDEQMGWIMDVRLVYA